MAFSVFPKQIVLAVSTSALFDMRRAHKVFTQRGESAFMKHMDKYAEEPLALGAAAGFVSKMLALNAFGAKVTFAIVSHQNPFGQIRIDNSLRTHGLSRLARGALSFGDIYSNGAPIEPSYLKAIGADIFLTTNDCDAQAALQAGIPAALVADQALQPLEIAPYGSDAPPRLAVGFDFDRVLGVSYLDSPPCLRDAEDYFYECYSKTGDLLEARNLYLHLEAEKLLEPMAPGPWGSFYLTLSSLRDAFRAVPQEAALKPQIDLSVITARTQEAAERMVRTLHHWKKEPDQKFSCGGTPKSAYAAGLDLFIDDSKRHIEATQNQTLAAYVPWQAETPREVYQDAFTRAGLAAKQALKEAGACRCKAPQP